MIFPCFRYTSKYHNKMPKLMSVDGTNKNRTSTIQTHKLVPIFKYKPSTFSILSVCFVLSIASSSFTNAQPYKTDLNDINWARYVAPSPLEMSSGSIAAYDNEEKPMDADVIEEGPEPGTNHDVSNIISNHYIPERYMTDLSTKIINEP